MMGWAQGQQALWNQYIGEHNIKLQWLDKNQNNPHPMGTVIIDQDYELGVLTLVGSQIKNDNEYVILDGVIEPISAMEFTFTDIITTRVSYINNDEDCVREGTFTFKKTKGRKYWRLQETTNCDDGVADYIDIY